MWGLIRLLAVIGALTGAAVTASTFAADPPHLPDWLPWAALFLGALLIGALMLLEQREHGGQPDWQARWQALPRWVRLLASVITGGAFLLAIFSHFGMVSGELVAEGGRYYAVRGQERTEITREQFERNQFRAERFVGPGAVFLNVNLLALTATRRRRGPAA